jgi:hypothetical protein
MDPLLWIVAGLAGLAPLAALPVAARLPRRRVRGVCGRCGYDLAGLEPTGTCPECGADYEAERAEVPRHAEILVWAPMWVGVVIAVLATLVVGVFSLGILLGPALILSGALCVLPVLPLSLSSWAVAQRVPRAGARMAVVGSALVMTVVAATAAVALLNAQASPSGGGGYDGLLYLAIAAPVIAGLGAPALGAVVAAGWHAAEGRLARSKD